MKKKPLKSRTVRLSDTQWDSLKEISLMDKEGRTLPSDVIRDAIDLYIKGISEGVKSQ